MERNVRVRWAAVGLGLAVVSGCGPQGGLWGLQSGNRGAPPAEAEPPAAVGSRTRFVVSTGRLAAGTRLTRDLVRILAVRPGTVGWIRSTAVLDRFPGSVEEVLGKVTLAGIANREMIRTERLGPLETFDGRNLAVRSGYRGVELPLSAALASITSFPLDSVAGIRVSFPATDLETATSFVLGTGQRVLGRMPDRLVLEVAQGDVEVLALALADGSVRVSPRPAAAVGVESEGSEEEPPPLRPDYAQQTQALIARVAMPPGSRIDMTKVREVSIPVDLMTADAAIVASDLVGRHVIEDIQVEEIVTLSRLSDPYDQDQDTSGGTPEDDGTHLAIAQTLLPVRPSGWRVGDELDLIYCVSGEEDPGLWCGRLQSNMTLQSSSRPAPPGIVALTGSDPGLGGDLPPLRFRESQYEIAAIARLGPRVRMVLPVLRSPSDSGGDSRSDGVDRSSLSTAPARIPATDSRAAPHTGTSRGP